MNMIFHFQKFLILIIGIFVLGFSVPVFAQSIEYAQERLMIVDQKGDEILFQLFVDTCKTGIKKCIRCENVAPSQSQQRRPRFEKENPILSHEKRPFKQNRYMVPLFEMEKTLDNLKKIIEKEHQQGLNISAGEIHSWAPSNFYYELGLSKVLMALATASSARFMYVGKEVALIEWIKTRRDHSITIETLFQQSLLLNKGNIYLALLTIENVLSDATFEEYRENTIVNQKLNDLYLNSPNKFGDWYHFFGTMLAGYVGEPAQLIAYLYSVYRKISRGDSAEKETMAADKAGADIGVELRHFLQEKDNAILKTRIQRRLSAVATV